MRRFFAIHATDPRGGDGGTSAERYHRRLSSWVTRLSEEASVALRLAAAAQHIKRWTIPRGDFPAGLSGYKRWRSTLARMHAEEAEAVLRDVGYGDDVVARVRALLLKKGLTADPEVQLFEDAICLAFLEGELADFAGKHDDDKLVSILQKTWAKMSPAGQAEAARLAERLDERARALIARAVTASSEEGRG